ncbi:MAG: MerR family transcriptional regulator [Lachnospiraceae bacterium]|nr:MerR family transcriptional regulator [Lachnospiraceae bacterium]
MIYTIGEMAKKLGIAPSTLRYYDKEGLLPFLEHPKGRIRVFTDKDYEWLHIIECLKKTDMQLKDIKTFIHMALQFLSQLTEFHIMYFSANSGSI